MPVATNQNPRWEGDQSSAIKRRSLSPSPTPHHNATPAKTVRSTTNWRRTDERGSIMPPRETGHSERGGIMRPWQTGNSERGGIVPPRQTVQSTENGEIHTLQPDMPGVARQIRTWPAMRIHEDCPHQCDPRKTGEPMDKQAPDQYQCFIPTKWAPKVATITGVFRSHPLG